MVNYDSPLAREVHSQFGLAFHYAQVFEKSLCNLAVGLLSFKEKGKTPYEEYVVLAKSLETRSIGPLLAEIRKEIEFSEEQLSLMKEAKDLRNFLAHNYFWENDIFFHLEKGQLKMANDLIAMQQILLNAIQIITVKNHLQLSKIGANQDTINRAMEKLIAAASEEMNQKA